VMNWTGSGGPAAGRSTVIPSPAPSTPSTLNGLAARMSTRWPVGRPIGTASNRTLFGASSSGAATSPVTAICTTGGVGRVVFVFPCLGRRAGRALGFRVNTPRVPAPAAQRPAAADLRQLHLQRPLHRHHLGQLPVPRPARVLDAHRLARLRPLRDRA